MSDENLQDCIDFCETHTTAFGYPKMQNSIVSILKELQRLRSHPTTPNAPAPEVIEKLTEALRFYADRRNRFTVHINEYNHSYSEIDLDKGDKARSALDLINGETK